MARLYSYLRKTESAFLTKALVQSVDRKRNTVTITTYGGADSITVDAARPLTPYLDNSGKGFFALPRPGTHCIAVLTWNGASYDAFIVGYFQILNGADTKSANPDVFMGDQGLFVGDSTRIVVRSSGLIEIKSQPNCKTVYKPRSNTISHFFDRYEMWRDALNYFTWTEDGMRVSRELAIYHRLSDLSDVDSPEPVILRREGYTRVDGSGLFDVHDEFNDGALIKQVVRSLSSDGAEELNRVITHVGRDADESVYAGIKVNDAETKQNVSVLLSKNPSEAFQLNISGEDPEYSVSIFAGNDKNKGNVNIEVANESSEVSAVIGQKEGGELVQISGKDDSTEFSVRVGSMEDNKVLEMGLNNKLVLSVDRDGGIKISNTGATVEIDSSGKATVVAKEIEMKDEKGGRLSLSGGKAWLGDGAENVIALLEELIGELLTVSPIGVSSMGPVNINPALQSKLNAIKNRVGSIK